MPTNRIILVFLILVLAMVLLGVQLANRPEPAPAPPIVTPEVVRTLPVTMYAYDPRLDMDAAGNVMCSDQGLVSVSRSIPATETPLTDAITLLFNDPLTEVERARGLTTEFPLDGVTVESVSLTNGTATIALTDREHRLSGGSCRVNVLRAQIEATAKQFPEVTHVRFTPEGVLEP